MKNPKLHKIATCDWKKETDQRYTLSCLCGLGQQAKNPFPANRKRVFYNIRFILFLFVKNSVRIFRSQ